MCKHNYIACCVVIYLMFTSACRRSEDMKVESLSYDSPWSLNVLAATMIPADDISTLEVYYEKGKFDGKRVPDKPYSEVKKLHLGLRTSDQNVIGSFLQAIREQDNRPQGARPEPAIGTWHIVFKSRDGKKLGYGQYILVAADEKAYGFIKPWGDGGFYYNTAAIPWFRQHLK